MNLKHATNTLSLLQEQKNGFEQIAELFLKTVILPKTWKLLQMVKTTNGQIYTLNSPKQPKKKVSLNLLKNSSWLLKLKSTTKNATVLFSKISKLLRSLKGAKLRFRNAAAVVTLLLVQKHQKFAQSTLTLNPTSKFELKIINFKNPQLFDWGFSYIL